MIALVLALILTFLSFYFACLSILDRNKQIVVIAFFIIGSFLLRSTLNVTLNNDYYYYYEFAIFSKPTGFLSYVLNEPYLYTVYSFFSLLIKPKQHVFLAMYWFNFIVSTLFFIWLLLRNDIEIWKKMLLFVLHYFVFGFVLLRNGPTYMLFALYFYYTFRGKRFNWIWITPFMHISSCIILITYFHKWRNYFKMLLVSPVVIIVFYLVIKTFFSSVTAFKSILSKVDIYSKGMPSIGYMHFVFFIFIFSLVVMGFIMYKSKMLHPILVTTVLLYGISFFVNPIVAHRFSPYLLFSLLLFPFEKIRNVKIMLLMNRLSILFFPIFLYSLFLAHKARLLDYYF
ncbi:hypothetical protein SAMN05444372_106160 [Flavobacterium micromati]|uniref:EpsG family protein n=1 Tax=Flavobacterium micromati TaxID=229205 RepID=A0A1M5K8W9_9FLAO|nr:hypothetical protein SAMN05444372_106160 [Flavobacterium micromati]